MKRRRIGRGLQIRIPLTIVIAAPVVFFLSVVPLPFSGPSLLPEYTEMATEPYLHTRQGLNQCGPYAASGVINVLRGREVLPSEINSETRWRLANGMTLPFGIKGTLRRHDVKSRHRLLFLLNDLQRISYLKRRLNAGRPMILLNRTPTGIQHYYTVIGYSNDEFYLYDSLQDLSDDSGLRRTRDDNGSLPGNRVLSSSELLEQWGNGGWPFLRWYLIECW